MSNPEELQTVPNEVIEQHVKLGEALKRLKGNADFQLLIEETYIKQGTLDRTSLLAVPAIKQRNQRPDVMEDLVSISNLQFFFMQVEQQYEAATDPVLSDEEEKELAEGNVQ